MSPSHAEVARFFAQGDGARAAMSEMLPAAEIARLLANASAMVEAAANACVVPYPPRRPEFDDDMLIGDPWPLAGARLTGRVDSVRIPAECQTAFGEEHWLRGEGDQAVAVIGDRATAYVEWYELWGGGVRIEWACSFSAGREVCVTPVQPAAVQVRWLDDDSTLEAWPSLGAFGYSGSATQLPGALVTSLVPAGCGPDIDLALSPGHFGVGCGNRREDPEWGVDVAQDDLGIERFVRWKNGKPRGWARAPTNTPAAACHWHGRVVGDCPIDLDWFEPADLYDGRLLVNPWLYGPPLPERHDDDSSCKG